MLVLKQSDQVNLPDSVVMRNETEIKAPLQQNYTYLRLLEYAKNEAKKQGGNVIKVEYYQGLAGGGMHLRSLLKVKIFYLSRNSLAAVKSQIDSIQRAYNDSIKTISIVNIRNYNEAPGKAAIFFNDSLVAKIRGRGFDGLNKKRPWKFVFPKAGALKIVNLEKNSMEKINIEIGKEYYIVLHSDCSKRGCKYYYNLIDKEHFENKQMIFESIF